ncbi:MAG: UDP-N-acetylmuramoyl-L-alanine--D-glutamate ligase, partial [Actinobacteria bacterium]|nr:UDP-N-acetylmuramoyl-L-alanine--D-glutamate ligase [Actinomycetota bacterium]
MSYAGKEVLVVGLGASGSAAAARLVELGAKVRVTESSSSKEVIERAERLRSQGAEVELGHHNLEHVHADIAIVSPGIPP